ncbi:MAG: ferritin family protein [Planctomycetes bacterium]|nr:ferritin family protein [Planctomycetota bacterium]MBL7143915.1 ferritin family protein [Phycisphaerae bacterium]
MAKPESDDEILQLAIDKEVEAYNFYLALANRVADQHIREAFEDLAKEELEHKAMLELEVMKTGKTITVEQNPARPERSYIVSNDPSPLDMDYKDMLMLGMEKEEAAFRTYVNLAASVNNEKSREVLLALAEEEVKHKLRFQTEYDILLKKR